MRRTAPWTVALSLALGAVMPSSAQTGRDACLDAARALVRQQARWDQSRKGDYRDDALQWVANDGTWGTCRLDSRGNVYEVRVEAWGRGGTSGYPGGGYPPAGGGYPPGGNPGGGSQGNRYGLSEEFGYDRRGSDYATLDARTLSQCQIACRDDSRCLAYTFSARESRCWLKSRMNEAQISRDMVTGYKLEDWSDGGGGNGWGNLTEEWDFDRRGNDFDDFRVDSVAQCKQECRDDNRCRAYTYDTRTRTCYLKDRANTPQRSAGMVTGYKQ